MEEVIEEFKLWAAEFTGYDHTLREDPGDDLADQYNAALVNVRALLDGVGANPKKISELTGIDGSTGAKYGRRLSAQGLWDGDNPAYGLDDLPIAALAAMGFVETRCEEDRSAITKTEPPIETDQPEGDFKVVP